MHWDGDIDLSLRHYTARLIISRALARGWHVTGFESNPAILFLYPHAKSKPIKILVPCPPLPLILPRKLVTTSILQCSS